MDVSFVTDRGVPVPAVTTDEMREVDRIAIEETGPNLFQMMENAGRNLAATAIQMIGGAWRDAEIVVLAGTGGNGGGGIAAARHLANRGGRVSVAVTEAERLTPVPAAQLEIAGHAGVLVIREAGPSVRSADLLIDAVIGYSLRSAPHGVAAEMIADANTAAAPVLALDVPSGVDATTGQAPGVAVEAEATMTLALPKSGLVASQVGDLLLADIGIPAEVYRRLGKPLDAAVFDDRWVVPLSAV